MQGGLIVLPLIRPVHPPPSKTAILQAPAHPAWEPLTVPGVDGLLAHRADKPVPEPLAQAACVKDVLARTRRLRHHVTLVELIQANDAAVCLAIRLQEQLSLQGIHYMLHSCFVLMLPR